MVGDVNWNPDADASNDTGGYTIGFSLTVLQVWVYLYVKSYSLIILFPTSIFYFVFKSWAYLIVCVTFC